jgi:crossover junction endodeoxyribonuclease RuvC
MVGDSRLNLPRGGEQVSAHRKTRILGIDPGLQHTGIGLIDVTGNHFAHVHSTVISSDSKDQVTVRLETLFAGLTEIVQQFQPDEIAVEEVYANRNGEATLKLGYARGVALLAAAMARVPVAEYPARTIKKTITGSGAADKTQVAFMIQRTFPGVVFKRQDVTDALGIAVCHAHHRRVLVRVG